jgi:hypothetical protein
MRGALPLPFWAFALLFAVAAPVLAKQLGMFFERRARERSRQILLPLLTSRASSDAERRDRS